MKVALIIGHLGKPTPDVGATVDVSGDGKVQPRETEAVLNLLYGAEAAAELLGGGHEVLVLADGAYADRAARARVWGADVVVHLHLDVRPMTAGRIYYDPTSPVGRGDALARAIAAELDVAQPLLAPAQAVAATPDRSEGAANLVALHRSDRAVAIVYEPARVSDVGLWLLRSSRPLVVSLGRGLAEGIQRWATSQPT